MSEIKGICPIIAAPFTEGGAIDYTSLDHLLSVLIKGGVHAVTLFGIAGEYYKLSDEERFEMARFTCDVVKREHGRIIISVTDHATEVAIRSARYFESLGADCLMLLPPFFLKPGADYLLAHMKAVANAVNIPVMIQYAPEQTGVPIAPSVFQVLGKECSNIKYFKVECKPSGPYITALQGLIGETGKIFVGNAGFQLIEGMDRGAIGSMPGCSMFDVYLDIYNSYKTDRSKAIEIHNLLLPMLNHIRQNVEQIIFFEKRILQKRGIIAKEYCRKPSYYTDPYFDRLFEEFYELLGSKYNW